MKTNEKVKEFDAVKMMKDVRDKVSEDTQSMTLDQFKKYTADKLKNSPLKAIGR